MTYEEVEDKQEGEKGGERRRVGGGREGRRKEEDGYM